MPRPEEARRRCGRVGCERGKNNISTLTLKKLFPEQLTGEKVSQGLRQRQRQNGGAEDFYQESVDQGYRCSQDLRARAHSAAFTIGEPRRELQDVDVDSRERVTKGGGSRQGP